MAEVFFKFMEYTRYGFIPEEELGFGFTRYLCIYIYIHSGWIMPLTRKVLKSKHLGMIPRIQHHSSDIIQINEVMTISKYG